MRWLVRLILVGLAFVAVREARDRHERLVAIGEDLEGQRRGIYDRESELDATDRSIDDAQSRVHELDEQLTAIERDNPRGISASVKPEYTRLLQERNDAAALQNDLIAQQRRQHDDYRAQVDRHNARVADAHAYASAPCAALPGWIRTRVCAETN